MHDQNNVAIKDGFVKTKRHGRLHFLETGSGEALILIPCNGGSAYEYERVLPLLAPHFRVIAWDIPGHGDSDPIDFYSIEDFADAVAATLDALKIKAAHVGGCSVGGSITSAFASRYPTRTL